MVPHMSIVMRELTSGCSCQRTVRIVAIPSRRVVEAVLDIVHEIEHLELYRKIISERTLQESCTNPTMVHMNQCQVEMSSASLAQTCNSRTPNSLHPTYILSPRIRYRTYQKINFSKLPSPTHPRKLHPTTSKMPKSKRAKIVHTSKTEKKGKELTIRLYANVQECVAKYPYCFVFSVDNMRNTYLKDVRAQLSDSRSVLRNLRWIEMSRDSLTPRHRLFFGKTKVMAVALGLTPATEPAANTSLLTPHMTGCVGLLFTPRDPNSILSYFSTFRPLDFARAGTIATRTFVLPSGTLYSRGGEIPAEEDVPLAHSIEPTLRKLGVPSRLVKGRIELDTDYKVCTEGEVLGSGQTTLLKMFGVATAEFGMKIKAYFVAGTGEVVSLEDGGGEEGGEGSGGMQVDEKEGEDEDM